VILLTGIGGITANSAASWINSIESAHFFSRSNRHDVHSCAIVEDLDHLDVFNIHSSRDPSYRNLYEFWGFHEGENL